MYVYLLFVYWFYKVLFLIDDKQLNFLTNKCAVEGDVCVSARVCVCVRARVCACVRSCGSVRVCMCLCVNVAVVLVVFNLFKINV